MPVDHSAMKLGRKGIRVDHRTLKMARYMLAGLPDPPTVEDWTMNLTSWGMLANDQLGDCTIAGCWHLRQVWTANTGGEITVTDDMAKSYYTKWCGWNPNDPNTDQGGIEIDVLNNWRQQTLGGGVLNSYVTVDQTNHVHVMQGVHLFGGLYIGLALPITAQSQDIWDVAGNPQTDANAQPGSWGGHCVAVVGYTSDGIYVITWGAIKKMTWAFWDAYCDESYALLSQDWINNGKVPNGFDLASLQTDLQEIAA